MVLQHDHAPVERARFPSSIDDTHSQRPIGGILTLRDSDAAFGRTSGQRPVESLGFASSNELMQRLLGSQENQPRTTQNWGDSLVRADMPTGAPAGDQPTRLQRLATSDPAAYAKEVHGELNKLTLALTSDINKSNEAMQVPRAVAESVLRTCTLFLWDGTGISQHSKWQNDIPARRKVSTGLPVDDKGTINVEPKDWQACLEEVQNHRDQLNRKWGNCGEQAASMCALLYDKIKNDPDYKGLQVRQAYSPKGHSWAELKYPDGSVVIYDPWGAQSGKRTDLKKLRDYYDDEKTCHSPWFGR